MKSVTVPWQQIATSPINSTSDSAITYQVEGVGQVWVTTDYARVASQTPDAQCVLVSISGNENQNVVWLFSRVEIDGEEKTLRAE